jgi:hypothetical protein
MRRLTGLLTSVLLAAALALPGSPAVVPAVADAGPCQGSISSNFNGTAIAGGATLWFNSVASVKGAVDGTQIVLSDSGVNFVAGGTPYTASAPDSVITFSAGATQATTVFDADQNAWVTTVPLSYSGNVFLAGAPFAVPATGLAGGINPVVWSWNATSSTAISIQWKWAAAVYTQFAGDLGLIGVKPVDGGSASVYGNSDHAGTPESYKRSVVGGARGGGGSNFTGSYSGTQAAQCGGSGTGGSGGGPL